MFWPVFSHMRCRFSTVPFLAVLIHCFFFVLANNSLPLNPFCATGEYVSFLDRLLAW